MERFLYFDVLQRSPLFSGMAEADISAALTCLNFRAKHFPRGAFLLRQGEFVRSVGLIVSGTVHILREDFWGNRDLIAAAGPGELFGEAYACAGVPAAVSVQAETETRMLFADVSRFLTTGAEDGALPTELLQNLLRATAEKNLLLNEKLWHVTRRTTREKLLSYLSRESARQGCAAFSIPFNRQQLADYLAVDRSALSAELGKLRDQGILTFQKNRFVLLREA